MQIGVTLSRGVSHGSPALTLFFSFLKRKKKKKRRFLNKQNCKQEIYLPVRKGETFLTGLQQQWMSLSLLQFRAHSKNKAQSPRSWQGEGGPWMTRRAGIMVNHRVRHAAWGWGQAAQHHRENKGSARTTSLFYFKWQPSLAVRTHACIHEEGSAHQITPSTVERHCGFTIQSAGHLPNVKATALMWIKSNLRPRVLGLELAISYAVNQGRYSMHPLLLLGSSHKGHKGHGETNATFCVNSVFTSAKDVMFLLVKIGSLVTLFKNSPKSGKSVFLIIGEILQDHISLNSQFWNFGHTLGAGGLSSHSFIWIS